jgi:hypothetical protein
VIGDDVAVAVVGDVIDEAVADTEEKEKAEHPYL